LPDGRADPLATAHVGGQRTSRYDFDIALAAAHRLGRHIGLRAGHDCTTAVLAILSDEELRVRLAHDIGRPPTADPARLWAVANGVDDTDPTDAAR
jgi:hypothetical protein